METVSCSCMCQGKWVWTHFTYCSHGILALWGPLGPVSFAPLSAFYSVFHISKLQLRIKNWDGSLVLRFSKMDSNSGSAIGQIIGRLGHISISLRLFLSFCKVGMKRRILVT